MPILLIDGPNLLFATREVFAAHWVEDYPGREARAEPPDCLV